MRRIVTDKIVTPTLEQQAAGIAKARDRRARRLPLNYAIKLGLLGLVIGLRYHHMFAGVRAESTAMRAVISGIAGLLVGVTYGSVVGIVLRPAYRAAADSRAASYRMRTLLAVVVFGAIMFVLYGVVGPRL